MKVKKPVLRTCCVTNEKLEKKELLRIVKDNTGLVMVDTTGKANGRGAYIKKDIEVLEKAIKTKALERHLECKIEDSIYEEIRNIIK